MVRFVEGPEELFCNGKHRCNHNFFWGEICFCSVDIIREENLVRLHALLDVS